MIQRISKFPTRTEFLIFRRRAKQLVAPHLRLLFLPHSPSRLSVIVPIKANKHATLRNYLKHLVYDALWPIIKDKQLDCVILFKPTPILKTLTLKQELTYELKQITQTL
jgi:RNase P protein component